MLRLRTIVLSICYTFKTVFWALVLLLLIIYCFSIVFAQAYLSHIKHMDSEDVNPRLALFWGGLLEAMFTLYKTIQSRR